MIAHDIDMNNNHPACTGIKISGFLVSIPTRIWMLKLHATNIKCIEELKKQVCDLSGNNPAPQESTEYRFKPSQWLIIATIER